MADSARFGRENQSIVLCSILQMFLLGSAGIEWLRISGGNTLLLLAWGRSWERYEFVFFFFFWAED